MTATLPEGIGAEIVASVPAEGPATADFEARVADLSVFTEALPGPATLTGRATRDDGGIEARFDLAAPQGITADVTATLPTEGPTVAEFDARVADVGAFTDLVEGPAVLTGTAMRDAEETLVNAEVQGPEGIATTLDARLAGDALRAELDMQVPDIGIVTDALSGPATVDATVTRQGGETQATLNVDGPDGITAQVAATLPQDGPIDATYDARIADVSALAPLPEGPATLSGTARRTTEGDITTDARLTAPAGIGADVTAALRASGDIEADLDMTIAEPGALREGLPGPIEAAVTARRTDGTWTVDADVTAPGDTELTLDATLPPEGDAAIDFDLRLTDPAPYLNGLPGPLTATGTARRTAEGWTADLDAQAADGSRVVADATLPDEGRATIDFDARLGDLGRFVPQLPGEATAQGSAAREDGTLAGAGGGDGAGRHPRHGQRLPDRGGRRGGDLRRRRGRARRPRAAVPGRRLGAGHRDAAGRRVRGGRGCHGAFGHARLRAGHLRPAGCGRRRLRRGARRHRGLRPAALGPRLGSGHADLGRRAARRRRGRGRTCRRPGAGERIGGARLRDGGHRRLRHGPARPRQPVHPPACHRRHRELRPGAERAAGARVAHRQRDGAGCATGAARSARRGGGHRRQRAAHGRAGRARRDGRAQLERAARRLRPRRARRAVPGRPDGGRGTR